MFLTLPSFSLSFFFSFDEFWFMLLNLDVILLLDCVFDVFGGVFGLVRFINDQIRARALILGAQALIWLVF